MAKKKGRTISSQPEKVSKITLRNVTSSDEELAMVRNGNCTFAVLQNGPRHQASRENPLFYVSTNENLPFLAGWTQIFNTGANDIKRYAVQATFNAITMSLELLYHTKVEILV